MKLARPVLYLALTMLLATCAQASVPSASATLAPNHFERLSAPSLSAALSIDSLEQRDDAPRFALGAVSLLGEPRSERFHITGDELRPQPLTVFEPSYPKTRVGVFDFLGAPLVGVSSGVSHELHWGCGDSRLGTPEGTGVFLSEDPAGDVDSPNRYAYVGWRPNEATDPTGEAAFLAPLAAAGVSGVVSVGVGAVASCVFDDCNYSWKDAAIDFGIGAATFGIGTGTSTIGRTGARWAARVGAEAVLDVGSEVARHEWKGERYTAQDLALGAVLNFGIGEVGALVGRGFTRSGGFAPSRGAGVGLPESLQLQKELSIKATRVGAALDRWLMSPRAATHGRYGRWARVYQSITNDPAAAARASNFAKGLRGRFLDRRMNQWMRRTYGGRYPNMRLDHAVPGSGSGLRPDVYIPDIGGKSFIFDFGGPSKIEGISAYEGLADVLVPIVPGSFMP